MIYVLGTLGVVLGLAVLGYLFVLCLRVAYDQGFDAMSDLVEDRLNQEQEKGCVLCWIALDHTGELTFEPYDKTSDEALHRILDGTHFEIERQAPVIRLVPDKDLN